MNKREQRAHRKLARQQQRKEKSVRLANTFMEENPSPNPKVQYLPEIEKRPSTDAQLGDLSVPKQVKSTQDGSRFGYKMTWCARLADLLGHWSWGESRTWSEEEWSAEIIPCLDGLESLDWSEIQNMNSDSGHLMHHAHEVTTLCDEAVQRWIELNYEQFETLFRFRLGNLKRAWGIEVQGHFFLVWYERNHLIYPTS